MTPHHGDTLPYDGTWTFEVQPVTGASGYLWRFRQSGALVWDNVERDGQLSDNRYVIAPGSPAHEAISVGGVQVAVRARVGGEYTEPTMISIVLR